MKRRFNRPALSILLLAVLASGCSQNPAAPQQRRESLPPDSPPLAVEYAFRSASQFATTTQPSLDTISRDFAVIRQLGLDTVLVKDVDPAHTTDLTQAASRHELHLIVRNPADPDDSRLSGPLSRAARINCNTHGADELATVRAWLLDYHLDLIDGRTTGVVFQPYRASAGSAGGIVQADQPLSAARAAMVKQIALRARHWHSLLEGLDEPPLELTDVGGAPVRAAILFGGNRSCLLIVNPSLDRFVRRSIDLPADVTNPPATRAVQAPAADQSPVGAVIEAAGSRLSIPVVLAPGDAALYELFAVRRMKDR